MLVFINYKQNIKPDHKLACEIESLLKSKGHFVFRDESVLQGGDHWPKKILNSLQKSDVVISLISNASMQSDWVLNEIDEAILLDKPLIPIMLETLDSRLNFMKYRPRFMDIQYITYKDNFDSLAKKLLESLKILKPASVFRHIISYPEEVQKILDKYNYEHPTEVFYCLLEILEHFHIVPAAAFELNSAIGHPKLIGGEGICRSFSEALAFATKEYADMYEHNFENHKKRGDLHNFWEGRVKPSACLAEILTNLLSNWQKYVEEVKKNMASRNKNK